MDIKITYNWLLDYLETDADPYEIQKYLSLCGPSIDRVHKGEDDYVFDIEVTTNRIDMASVFGIAQEAQAILPQFGKKAVLKYNPLDKYTFSSIQEQDELPLHLEIDSKLATRFTMAVIKGISIHPSEEIIRKRLTYCGINSINNVVDVSNYLMLSLGQPSHVFDYDRITEGVFKMRLSQKGEKIVTLDKKELTLPGNDIVMEDASGKLIDLCGVMGGLSSSVTENTKNVVLFVQTYDKRKIRRTSMTTAQRTIASTYFEKGLDENRVEHAFVYGIDLLLQQTGGLVASKLYDIYPTKNEPKHISVSLDDINRVMGVEVELKTVRDILSRLGFGVEERSENVLNVIVPTYRIQDIELKEDIIEEIARVWGYHNLPNNIQNTGYVKQPKEMEQLFSLQSKTKYTLKHYGFHESMNYSMISADLIKALGDNPDRYLKIKDAISAEIEYMRQSLFPSLLKNVKDNEGKSDSLNFFEIAKVYSPHENDLPDEKFMLALATNGSFYDLKGAIEVLARELNIQNIAFTTGSNRLFSSAQAEVWIDDKKFGDIGLLSAAIQEKLMIKQPVMIAELDFTVLMENYHLLPRYVAPNPFAAIKLDLTINDPKYSYQEMTVKAHEVTPFLKEIHVIDTFKNNITLRFLFNSSEKNLTEIEAKQALDQIKTIFS
ncbi:phenylalanine--tRNA ligase subunit beta [Candidatus Roizmanbacteria bacterium]|nr:phenylalanine--tRNA ligase subunit beta [Candidatus Roizmanbacteria bacterium]